MTRRADFAAAVRRGRRAGRSRLVAHALLGPPVSPARGGDGLPSESTRARSGLDAGVRFGVASGVDGHDRERSVSGGSGASSGSPDGDTAVDDRVAAPAGPALVGFVVSKAVGGSVVRHRVQRRLRHVVRDRLPVLPAGTLLVVRALPPAANATSAELAGDVDAAFRRLGLTVRPPTVDAASVPITVPSDAAAAVDNPTPPVDGSS